MAEPQEWPRGAALGPWVSDLERACFGEAWGGLWPGERLWVVPERAWARWSVIEAAAEAELLRIAVHPAARRRGLARRLLAVGARTLAAEGIRSLFLEVRERNLPARSLYLACGWVEHGLRRGYYPDGEDAVLYRKSV